VTHGSTNRGGSASKARASGRPVDDRGQMARRRAVAGRRKSHVRVARLAGTSPRTDDGRAPRGAHSISIIGCDAANGTYFQLYSDERGVCRIYEMSINDDEWNLWREGEPFSQRFTARISDDGNTITGRWEIAEDFAHYTTDFDLIYRRVVT